MRRLICIIYIVFSVILCSCSAQKSIILNQKESNSEDKIYEICDSQNKNINIIVYEYLNGKWKILVSDILENNTKKVILSLIEPKSGENEYYLQISCQDDMGNNIKDLEQIAFQENSSFFHQKNVSEIKINKELQNLAIYEWLDNNDVCIYDLNTFKMSDSYDARRAYLILIGLYNDMNC